MNTIGVFHLISQTTNVTEQSLFSIYTHSSARNGNTTSHWPQTVILGVYNYLEYFDTKIFMLEVDLREVDHLSKELAGGQSACSLSQFDRHYSSLRVHATYNMYLHVTQITK